MISAKQERWCLYRCVFGPYDEFSFGLPQCEVGDCFLFTDQKDIVVPGWTVIVCPEVPSSERSIANRMYKLTIPEMLRHYDFSVYLDGNVHCIRSLKPLCSNFLRSGGDVGLFSHPDAWRTVKDEAGEVVRHHKADSAIVEQEMNYYSSVAPTVLNMKISDNSILFRRHSRELFKAMDEWFLHLRKYTGRDQLSLPYVLEKFPIQVFRFGFAQRRLNSFFFVVPHKGLLKRSTKSLVFGRMVKLISRIRSRSNQ